MENKVARNGVSTKFVQGRQQAHSEACRTSIEGLLKGGSVGAARLAWLMKETIVRWLTQSRGTQLRTLE